MKRVLSICLSTVILLLSVPIANASEISQDIFSGTISYSEYDIFEAFSNYSEQELKAIGFQDEEIAEITSFNLEEIYTELAQKSYDELRALRYTDEQISLIQAYDGSPLDWNSYLVQATEAICEGTYRKYGTANTTEITITYSWSWNVAPQNKKTDAVAMAWIAYASDGTEVVSSGYNSSAYVNYYLENGNLQAEKVTVDTTSDGFYSAYINFKMQKNISSSGTTMSSWAQSGHISVTVKPIATQPKPLAEVQARGAYGHSVLGLTPSIGGSKSGLSFSLSTTIGVEELGVCGFYRTSNNSCGLL